MTLSTKTVNACVTILHNVNVKTTETCTVKVPFTLPAEPGSEWSQQEAREASNYICDAYF